MLPAQRTGKKILIVEDDYILAESLSLILSGEGYMVAIAPNGSEALQRLRSPERPHLILLDLMLPQMDGWQFRSQQQQDPVLAAIPTVVFSAVPDLQEQAAALGAADFLQKPVETNRLLESIKRHCC